MRQLLLALALAFPALTACDSPKQAPVIAAAKNCCKICKKGCACGDSCIACDKVCHKGEGCACNAR